jgi:putative flippase GtrA
MLLSFAANRRWTFRSAGAPRGQAARFAAAHAGTLAVSAGLTELGVTYGGLPPAACSLLLVVPVTLLNFTVQRLWVFKA